MAEPSVIPRRLRYRRMYAQWVRLVHVPDHQWASERAERSRRGLRTPWGSSPNGRSEPTKDSANGVS